jgi:hypothetical protein
MWCSNCHQDLPGVNHPATGRLVCSRCQHAMTGSRVTRSGVCDDGIDLTEPVVTTKKTSSPPIRADDWSARRRARELDRALRRPMHIGVPVTKNPLLGARRFDPPQDLFDQLEQVTTPAIKTDEPPITSAKQLIRRQTGAAQVFSWLVVATGALTVAGGVGLLSWSLFGNVITYWNLALGLTLGGQGALILGLVLVVSRLWRNSRFASGKLQEVHARLGQLQQTADVLTSMRSGGAPAFYADLARGASPQMMLGNLKGQLDQLAARIGT